MTEKKLYQAEQAAVEQAGVKTYGYTVRQVAEALSDEMNVRLGTALQDLYNIRSRAFVEACFDVYMQMKSVGSEGELKLADRTVIDTQTLLLAGEGNGGVR